MTNCGSGLPANFLLSPAIVLIAIIQVGCGDGRPPRVPVSGQVLIDGQPVKSGFIRVIPSDHRPSQGNLDENGRFTLSCFDDNDGAVLGQHRVEIRATEMINPQLMRWHAPKKYADQQSSGLILEITGPTNDAVLNLSWGGERSFDEKVELPLSTGSAPDGKY
jgi:hypothetical protein